MYHIEDLRFMNMKTRRDFTKKHTFFEIEDELSLEEKIVFIDVVKDNIATYLINLFARWETEKESLPRDNYGYVKKVSKKAWIKRNDSRKIIDVEYTIGNYYLLRDEFKEMSLECPRTGWGYDMAYTGFHVAHQWFHLLCKELYRNEVEYFRKIDSREIKIEKVKELINQCGTFNTMKLNDIRYNSDRDISEEKLDMLIELFNEFGKIKENFDIRFKKILD